MTASTGTCVAATAVLAPTAADAMITRVKTSRANTTVAELLTLFEDQHVHAAVLVTEDGVLLTVLERADLTGHPPDAPALALGGRADRIVAPDADLEESRRLLVAARRRRLAVVDADGTLRGLLCLKRTGTGFCSDRDVRARANSARVKLNFGEPRRITRT